jgi:hypothetical protein
VAHLLEERQLSEADMAEITRLIGKVDGEGNIIKSSGKKGR